MKGLSVVGYINDLVFYCLWRRENEKWRKRKGKGEDTVEAYALKSTGISFPSFIHWFQSPHPCMNLSLIINSFLLFEIDVFPLILWFKHPGIVSHLWDLPKGMKRDMPKTLEWRSWEIIGPFSLSIFKSFVGLNMLNMHSIFVYPLHCANSKKMHNNNQKIFIP